MTPTPPPTPPGTMSHDGLYRWDGTTWQPANPTSSAPPGTVSADGHYVWDGAGWQPIQGPSTQPSVQGLSAVQVPQVPAGYELKKKSNTGRNLGIGCLALVVLFVVAAVASQGGKNTNTTTTPSSVPVEAGSDYSTGLENSIKTDGASQIKANLAKTLPNATVVVDDANCVQTAGTQTYTCLAHYTVNDPADGLNNQKYLVNITGTCNAAGTCQWHTEGTAQPVG